MNQLAVSSDLVSPECAVDLGADAYLKKPVSLDSLQRALQQQGLLKT